MKVLCLLFLVVFLIGGCDIKEEQRSMDDAARLAAEFNELDDVFFVVETGCDYDYFLEYVPMRPGGFFAYGRSKSQTKLLLIPVLDHEEVKLVDWPLPFTVEQAVALLNSSDQGTIIDSMSIYDNVRFELTDPGLSHHDDFSFDIPFFIEFKVHQDIYVAVAQDSRIVIYHQETGRFVEN